MGQVGTGRDNTNRIAREGYRKGFGRVSKRHSIGIRTILSANRCQSEVYTTKELDAIPHGIRDAIKDAMPDGINYGIPYPRGRPYE